MSLLTRSRRAPWLQRRGMTRTLSSAQARRIAIAAQELASPKPGKPVTPAPSARSPARLGALQLDSVNVFAHTPWPPGFSRLGPYDPAILQREAWGKKRSLFEYWGHAASLMPMELQAAVPLEDGKGTARADGRRGGRASRRPTAPTSTEGAGGVRQRGPVTGGDFAPEGPRKSNWWEVVRTASAPSNGCSGPASSA